MAVMLWRATLKAYHDDEDENLLSAGCAARSGALLADQMCRTWMHLHELLLNKLRRNNMMHNIVLAARTACAW
jgi:hypothetical protein